MASSTSSASTSSAVAVLEYDCPVYGNNSDFVIEQGIIKNSFGTDLDNSLFSGFSKNNMKTVKFYLM